jgi:hypothetical protein
LRRADLLGVGSDQIGQRDREGLALSVGPAATDIAPDRDHRTPVADHAPCSQLAHGDGDSAGRGLHHLGVEAGNRLAQRIEVAVTGVARQVELDIRHELLVVAISSRVARIGGGSGPTESLRQRRSVSSDHPASCGDDAIPGPAGADELNSTPEPEPHQHEVIAGRSWGYGQLS